ncbi:carboxypeptidase-like regulatory domain-containing protein [Gimesia aquarii]|uniref:Carboxypeptidase regulatory-like domain-containing protein n=1 Tax=Gimesia aquarii TaxID=2527964 RepID=A0A517W386_9PLAN|nr:carboxypeptidase-like regulatory domain-containing protein [Gimesia aquarii]QDT99722.1 hypothetical protein V144x_52350 [Gimesia aquarii]
MLRSILGTILVVMTTGCGGGVEAKPLPKTVPVSGVVTLNGQPLASATVTFIPHGQTKGIECQGTTDESGQYTLKQQHGTEGAPPGNYKVVVSRLLRGDGTPLPKEGAGAGGIATETLSRRYSDVTKTKLTAVVPQEGGEFKFDLKSKK